MRRPVRFTAAILFLLVSATALTALGSVSVAPLSMVFDAIPGETDTAAFVIRNTGSEPADVTITLHDWWRTAEGGFLIYEAESLERSCAGWTVCSAEAIRLEPGEEEQISVELLVPESIQGDHWAVFLVEEQPTPVEEDQADEGLTNTTRVAVTYAVKILYVDPVHKDRNAEIRSVEVLASDPLLFRIVFANTGASHITTQGTVEIRDIFGDTVRSYAVDRFPSLPGEEKHILIEDPSEDPLPRDLYYVIAVFDFGGEHLIQGGLQLDLSAEATSDAP